MPLAEIAQREIILAQGTNHVAGTNAVAKIKLPAPPAAPPPLFKHWKGEAEVGLDLYLQRLGPAHLSRPLQIVLRASLRLQSEKFLPQLARLRSVLRQNHPKQQRHQHHGHFLRPHGRKRSKPPPISIIDWYAYNLAGVGFDRIRNIDLAVEVGPGLGYHLFTRTNFTANVEGGVNYQIQYNSDNTQSRDFFFRLAEDVIWKIGSRTTFSEKVEFFPRVNFTEYRLRAETTLSYNLWRYIYWNFTVRDYYDTTPAAKVQGNEFEVHSALGVKF